MKNKKSKTFHRAPVCPYCGSRSILRDSSYVYREQLSERQLYVCARYPKCNSYVGVHAHSLRPKGTLANSELRNKRIVAHRIFDEIWKSGIMTRHQAYVWLQGITGLPESKAHIGMFSDYYCDEIIRVGNEVLTRCQKIKEAA